MKKLKKLPCLFFLLMQGAWAADRPKVNILAYSSLQGSGSLGEWILKQPKSPCAHLDCHFVTPHPNRSLFEELRSNKDRVQDKIDIVIGIDTLQLQWAGDADLLKGSAQLMGESPLVILIHKNSKAAADSGRPLTWKEVAEKMKGRVVVQDPRYSAIAQTFLIWGIQKKLFSIADFKKMTARVFPKWSASFEYFSKSPDLGLLTFATSQSYNDCHPKDEPTRFLQISGDVPRYQEWIASLAPATDDSPVTQLLNFLKSDDFAKAVPELDWLISSKGLENTSPCFHKSFFPPSSPPNSLPVAEYQKWMDEWAL